MKKHLTNKSFWYGSLLAALTIFSIAAASKQLIGPSIATTPNAIAIWADSSAWKLSNSGVTISSPAGITYNAGFPTMQNLGTISGAGTATLTSTSTAYYGTFSGATATIALPSLSAGVSGTWIVHGTTTYNSGTQIITVPSLIRPELDPSNTVSTFTNASSANGKFTVAFTAINGTFVKFSVIGDNF